MGTLSADPIGFYAGDANLYRYVGNGAVNLNDPSGLAPPLGSGIVELNLRPEALGPSQFEQDLAEFQAKTDYIARKSEERRTNGRTFEELLNHFNYLQTTEGAERERFLKTGEAYMPGFRAMSDAEQNAHMALTIPMLAASEVARKERYLQEDIADREFFQENVPIVGHTALEGIGLIPGLGIPADLLNGVWYAAEGDYVNAGFSFGAAIPAAGYAFNVAKAGSTSSRLYRASRSIDIAHNFTQSGYESYQGYRNGNVIQIGLGAFGFGLNARVATSLSPNSVASSIEDVVGGIGHNADVATELARRAAARGRISPGAQSFGIRAHTYFERLNNRLSRRLADEGSDFRVFTEEFRDALGNVVSRRARGSIGADAIVRNLTDPSLLRIFDLKTHGGVLRFISAARQNQFLQRFGANVVEIFRKR